MRRYVARLGLLLAIAVLFASVSAMADAFGAPGSRPGDWSQLWCSNFSCTSTNVNAITEFQLVVETSGVNVTTTDAYNDMGETSPVSGWFVGTPYTHSGYSVAYLEGPADLNEFFDTLSFSSPSSTPFTIVQQAWTGATFDSADSASCTWNGGSWNSCTTLSGSVVPEVTPEPATVALLGFGLLGLGLIGISRRRLFA